VTAGVSAIATATAAATTATAATTPVVPSASAAAITAIAPAARLRPRQQVHQVVEVALLLRARRRIFAGHHAHETHVVRPPAHHLQRLHQPGQAVTLDAHLLFDLCRGANRALVSGRGRGRCLGRAFGFARRL